MVVKFRAATQCCFVLINEGVYRSSLVAEVQMKRSFLLLLILVALVCESLAADQSANKIVDRYRKASGGKSAGRLKSILMTGSVKASDGTAGRFDYRASAPNNLRVDLETGGSKVSECYNGKSAWRLDGRGLRTLLGDEAKRLRLESLLANSRLNDLQRNRIVTQLAGKATVDGRDANAVEFTRDGVRIKLFFDGSSNLAVKRERETADGLEETFYSDYRAIDGVMGRSRSELKKAPAT
jgi:hypothetical protein